MYIIVGGGGDIGYYLTKSLLHQGHEVVLLEKNVARFQALSEELNEAVYRGDACEARTMEKVGVNRADMVIAVTGDDEDNLVICQMAKKHFNVKRTIARLNNPKHERIFRKLGIDLTVSPTSAILSLINVELPSSGLVPLIKLQSAGLEIVEIRVPEESPVVGKKLNTLNLPRICNLALIVRGHETMTPTAETELLPNDQVFALVTPEGEETLRKTFGTKS